ncbi:Serine/threonine-protein phosphatase 6 regulatory ankyrin repeat subunit C [Paramyrothecium foliicola]|nr:Serine/threonine-protein phosphatase 6 regulatory ankyrin repeat subunit C [Paramyrothecium foliicola]
MHLECSGNAKATTISEQNDELLHADIPNSTPLPESEGDDLQLLALLSVKAAWLSRLQWDCDKIEVSYSEYARELGEAGNALDLSQQRRWLLQRRRSLHQAAEEALNSPLVSTLAKLSIAPFMVSVGSTYHLQDADSAQELGSLLYTDPKTISSLQTCGDIASALSLQERNLSCLVGGTSAEVWTEEFQRFCDLYRQFRSILVMDTTTDDDQLPDPPEVCLPFMDDTSPALSAAVRYFPHPSGKDLFGRTLLHLILGEDRAEDLDIMIRKLPTHDLNSKDYFGRTPLHIAATLGSENGVRKLMDAGADANQREYADGLTPLQCAAAAGHPAITKMILAALLRNSPNNFATQTQMALSLATRNGRLDVISLLDPGRGLQEGENARANTTIITPEIPGMMVVTDGSGYNSIAKLAVDWAEDIPENLGESESTKNRDNKRLARSHAVKQALRTKREAQQQSGDNFRAAFVKPDAMALRKDRSNVVENASRLTPLLGVLLDPVQALVADSPELQAWCSRRRRVEGNELVFSTADELVLHNFRTIFRTGLHDMALLSAAMLTFSFAATGSTNDEFLRYRGQALHSIRVKMVSPENAASEVTMGAILLLARMETRFSVPGQVQMHLNAIKQLLAVSRTHGIHLTDQIKRAIFWQDLNSSTMTGSYRIVDHTTFAELQWKRDPFTPSDYVLPPGFRKISHLLTQDLVEILEDINSLGCIRDMAYHGSDDVLSMARIDNQQASIQSRLAELVPTSGAMECIRLGAYLSSTTLRCKMWPASIVPSHLSVQLLAKLQTERENPVWDMHANILVWLLCIGGAFAPVGTTRIDFINEFLSGWGPSSRLIFRSWPELLVVLKQFIWSDKAFASSAKKFWEEAASKSINNEQGILWSI